MVEAPIEEWEPVHRHLLGAVSAECLAMRSGFRNWPSLLGAIALGRLRGQPPALQMQARGGPIIHTVAGDRSWWTVVEVFGRDCYRLASTRLPSKPLVVDIGANIGAFTLGVLARWPEACVWAVEASPRAVGQLVANLGWGSTAARVTVRHAAVVGARQGPTVLLDEHAGDLCTSTLRDVSEARASDQVVDVPAVTLAELLGSVLQPGVERVDLCKVDVEGAEYEIVLGTPLKLLGRIDRLVLEYHAVPGRDVADIARHLHAAGLRWQWHEHCARPGHGLAGWIRPEPPR